MRLGLNLIFTRELRCLATLLLIGALASLALMLIGLVAENKNLQYQFQTNMLKKHRVLSLIFLGMLIIEHYLQIMVLSQK